jgi:hypothetical protein
MNLMLIKMSTYKKQNLETTDEEVELIEKLQKQYPEDYQDIYDSFYASPSYMEKMLIKQAKYRFE